MNEQLMQFIWQHRYFSGIDFFTTKGASLSILKTGMLNTNQGPDFSHAEILLDGLRFIGNIELHIRASDWHKHNHDIDARYQHVILHVVWELDEEVVNNAGVDVPSLILAPYVSKLMIEKFKRLMFKRKGLPCAAMMEQVKPIVWQALQDRMSAERLERKAQIILNDLAQHKGDWNMTALRLLARVMGGKINGDCFDRVVQQLTYQTTTRLSANAFSMQAWLFGVAGLLDGLFDDTYPLQLQDEFTYLKNKFKYTPVPECKALFLRMRPAGFPTIRLSQLGVLITTVSPIFSKLIEINTKQKAYTLFNISAEAYWDTHFCFDQPAPFLMKTIGTSQKDLLLINVLAPLLFAFGMAKGNEMYKEQAMNLLQEIAGERNAYLYLFPSSLIPRRTAHHTQALLELYTHYCSVKKCLQCGAGNAILKTGVITN